MKILGKPFREYLKATSTFLFLVFLITVVQLPLFLLEFYPRTAVDPVGLLKIVVIGWAGWVVVKRHKFSLKQAAMVGAMLFMATIWILPLVQFSLSSSPFALRVVALLIIMILNLIVYALAAIFGGWLAQRVGSRV